MELLSFDKKFVRITMQDGEIFDGRCMHCSEDYAEYLLDRPEEALEIDHWIFFESDIREVRQIDENDVFLWMSLPLHRMRLEYGPFDKIDREKKTIELRLFDEKRRRIRVGDVIRFECTLDEDALYVRVKALHVFPSFEDLFQKLPLTACGYADASGGEPAEDMRRYYSAEDERKYGVVGIEIEQLLD